jgi:RNA polymerase sigma-70 factor (ECF subfamily)
MAKETAWKCNPLAQKIGSRMVKDRILTEKEILAQVQKGKTQAYQHIVHRYMQTAYYIALGFVHNHQDALDLSQDSFIKAFRSIKSFDINRDFFPWFYRILKNLCIDHFKRIRCRREVPLEEVKILVHDKEDKEMKEAMWRGIEELSFEQREIIILRYFRGYSYQEIAEITGKPIGTVMSSLHYAKKKLKEMVGKYLGFEKE